MDQPPRAEDMAWLARNEAIDRERLTTIEKVSQ